MNKLRIYVDTSIIGGVFDEEFKKASSKFFEQVKADKFQLVISALVQEEITEAPDHIQQYLDGLENKAEIVDITEEALKLRESYLKANILSKNSRMMLYMWHLQRLIIVQ